MKITNLIFSNIIHGTKFFFVFQKKAKSQSSVASPPTVTVTSHKSNQPTNGGGKNNSETTMVGQHGNPAAMNSYEFNRIHSSAGTGGNGESGMLVHMPQQQQKNSLNMAKTSSNGDNLQGVSFFLYKNRGIFQTLFWKYILY